MGGGSCALGALCTVGDACKKRCATHTAGMSCMQSIESVSRGRQGGREGGGRHSLEEAGGSELKVGSTTTS